MLLAVCFDAGSDIIEVPEFIGANAEDYRGQFLVWLCDKNNNHDYWICKDGDKWGLSYRSDALVEWLNSFPLSDNDEKARIIVTFVWEYNEDIPSIFF
ncbi:MAG: hypothetical protein FWB80_11240 [Defluviitaleaceae bacterium]|nr:hypothetical protein [Defluviitaleaceae bacterium]